MFGKTDVTRAHAGCSLTYPPRRSWTVRFGAISGSRTPTTAGRPDASP
jgi:hypothetical protein